MKTPIGISVVTFWKPDSISISHNLASTTGRNTLPTNIYIPYREGKNKKIQKHGQKGTRYKEISVGNQCYKKHEQRGICILQKRTEEKNQRKISKWILFRHHRVWSWWNGKWEKQPFLQVALKPLFIASDVQTFFEIRAASWKSVVVFNILLYNLYSHTIRQMEKIVFSSFS